MMIKEKFLPLILCNTVSIFAMKPRRERDRSRQMMSGGAGQTILALMPFRANEKGRSGYKRNWGQTKATLLMLLQASICSSPGKCSDVTSN
jgi:hypothetical protein